jgi:hypothetical protein
MYPQITPTVPPSRMPTRHGQAPWTESDLLRLDPNGPLDHLLQGFESAYRMKRPEQRIILGHREATVAELMKEEREEKLAKLRESIRQAHANQAKRREQAQAAAKAEADARAGRPRAELVEALAAYETWTRQYWEAERLLTEAREQKTKLSNSDAPIATLEKTVLDAGATIEAAQIRFDQIKAQGREPTQRLKDALGPAQGEFSLRLSIERGSRIKANLATLQKLGFDSAALQRAEVYQLDRLAACFQNVTRLGAVEYRSYGGHPTAQAHELLAVFDRLDTELSSSKLIE